MSIEMIKENQIFNFSLPYITQILCKINKSQRVTAQQQVSQLLFSH